MQQGPTQLLKGEAPAPASWLARCSRIGRMILGMPILLVCRYQPTVTIVKDNYYTDEKHYAITRSALQVLGIRNQIDLLYDALYEGLTPKQRTTITTKHADWLKQCNNIKTPKEHQKARSQAYLYRLCVIAPDTESLSQLCDPWREYPEIVHRFTLIVEQHQKTAPDISSLPLRSPVSLLSYVDNLSTEISQTEVPLWSPYSIEALRNIIQSMLSQKIFPSQTKFSQLDIQTPALYSLSNTELSLLWDIVTDNTKKNKWRYTYLSQRNTKKSLAATLDEIASYSAQLNAFPEATAAIKRQAFIQLFLLTPSPEELEQYRAYLTNADTNSRDAETLCNRYLLHQLPPAIQRYYENSPILLPPWFSPANRQECLNLLSTTIPKEQVDAFAAFACLVQTQDLAQVIHIWKQILLNQNKTLLQRIPHICNTLRKHYGDLHVYKDPQHLSLLCQAFYQMQDHIQASSTQQMVKDFLDTQLIIEEKPLPPLC